MAPQRRPGCSAARSAARLPQESQAASGLELHRTAEALGRSHLCRLFTPTPTAKTRSASR
eukprot:4398186-Alexandrium_andersonii.AAC.1